MIRLGLALAAAFVTASLSAAAPPAQSEIKLLDGKTVKGTVLALSVKEVKVKVGEEEKTLSADTVIGIDLQPPSRPLPPTVKHLQVRLNDGTLFRCQAFALVGPNATLRLFGGQALTIPVANIHWILCDAQDEANRAEFEELLHKKTIQDRVRLQSKADAKIINTLEGFVGDADAKGATVRFKLENDAYDLSISRIRGIIYVRNNIDPKAFNVVCKVYDQFQNAIVVEKLDATEDGFKATTPTGVTIEYPRALVQRLDLSMGKLAYLSDLDPTRVEEQPLLADIWKYRRDKNLEGGQISVGRKTYAKGLTVHSRTVLEYDVTGYNLFRCIVGIDDAVSGPSHAVVRIEADGKEIWTSPVTGKDKPKELELKLGGATRLRLTVEYGEDLDLGDHVVFAEARVTK
jgi:molybdopterin-binding protein